MEGDPEYGRRLAFVGVTALVAYRMRIYCNSCMGHWDIRLLTLQQAKVNDTVAISVDLLAHSPTDPWMLWNVLMLFDESSTSESSQELNSVVAASHFRVQEVISCERAAVTHHCSERRGKTHCFC